MQRIITRKVGDSLYIGPYSRVSTLNVHPGFTQLGVGVKEGAKIFSDQDYSDPACNEGEGSGSILTLSVGDVYWLDGVRMELLKLGTTRVQFSFDLPQGIDVIRFDETEEAYQAYKLGEELKNREQKSQ